MLWKNIMMLTFKGKELDGATVDENDHRNVGGFRIVTEETPDDKFFVIDDVDLNIGDIYRISPTGFFELIEKGPAL